MSLIRNEQTKLTATYVNGMAITLFAVGGLAPLISRMNTGEGLTASTVILGLVCIFTSVALHFGVRFILKGLKQ